MVKIIILVLLIILFIALIFTNYCINTKIENFQDIPVQQQQQVSNTTTTTIQSDTTKVEIIKNENKNINKLTEKLQSLKKDLLYKIEELEKIIAEKLDGKRKLEKEIEEIDKQLNEYLSAIKLIKNNIDKNVDSAFSSTNLSTV